MSTNHQHLQLQRDLGCEVTQPWDQRQEMSRSNECLVSCAICPRVSTSVSFLQNGIRSSCCSQVPGSGEVSLE